MIRRIMPEQDAVIPHAPSRTPAGRCCCSSGGVCYSDYDFEMMYWVNKTQHPENYKHITGPRAVRLATLSHIVLAAVLL